MFRPVKYDYENIKFTDLSMLADHAVAITEDGYLYAWGSNISKRSGFAEDIFDGVFEPKKIDFLVKENLRALKVSCGYDHTLLLCEDRDIKDANKNV
jgi:alpha-tubulin suppressor-like RCC1 family protein